MLIISRKTGESIHIGPEVTVEVRRVNGDRVTLRVDAPDDVKILRNELGVPEQTATVIALEATPNLWLARQKSNNKLMVVARTLEHEEHFQWEWPLCLEEHA